MAAHSEVLHREYDRIADITNRAYFEMMHPDAPSRASGNYASWAALLLRYHDAIERVSSGDEPDEPPVSMKGQPDVKGARPKPTRPDPSGSPSVELGS